MDHYAIFDVPMSRLPDHLRYRPPTVPNTFEHVESRYRNPPSPKRQPEMPTFSPDLAPNTRFAGVESRYRSPQKEDVARSARYQPAELLKRTESVKSTPEYAHHKRVAAAAGFGNAESRYREVFTRQESGPTPKDRVNSRLKTLAEKKDGVAFKAWSTQAKTFSDMARENEQLKRWESPPIKSKGKTSVVMDWVDRGVPIPTARKPSPPRRPSPEPRMGDRPYAGAGGAGGGAFDRRANSPVKRGTRLEDTKVRTLTSTLATARTSSPPRVAAVPTASVSAKYGLAEPFRRTESPSGRSNNVSLASLPPSRPRSPTARTVSPTRQLYGARSSAAPSETSVSRASATRGGTASGGSSTAASATVRRPNPNAAHRTTHHVPPVRPQTSPPQQHSQSQAAHVDPVASIADGITFSVPDGPVVVDEPEQCDGDEPPVLRFRAA